ncbi:MAG: uroporphyrinogen-III synthase, partial [Burkholderiales bacterium]|nr:uroporphyrinogen-III synthase [Burkholderiales bacterium]
MSTCDLDGIGVLVTRPQEQARSLVQDIRHLGGVPTVFPGVEIEPLVTSASSSVVEPSSDVDLVIFVSPSSVRLGMPRIKQRFGLPRQLLVAAVGQSTAAALKGYGLSDVIVPRHGSGVEALLEVPQLKKVSGWSVIVVRGEGGNQLLESILKLRGANVSVIECYRRHRPTATFSVVAPLFRDGRIGAWMATSAEILDNLLYLAGAQGALLRDTPLFVNHPHVANHAFSQAVKVIFVTTGGDKGLVAGLAT